MASRAVSASKRGSSGRHRPLVYCLWMALQLSCNRTATTHRSHPPQSPSRHSAVLLPADAGSKRRATRSWQLVLTERITTFTHRIHACSHDRRPQCAAARVTQCAAPHTAGSSGALERHGFGPSVQKKTKSLLVFLPCPVQHCDFI